METSSDRRAVQGGARPLDGEKPSIKILLVLEHAVAEVRFLAGS